MRTVSILLACIVFYSCSESPKVIGSWRTTYFNADATTDLKFFFNDFDFYDPPEYVPVIRIGKDSIEYALGIGVAESYELGGNSYKYFLRGSNFEIVDKKRKQSFAIALESERSFCLFNGNTKVVCFTQAQNLQGCSDYEIDLMIKSEYYSHKLLIEGDGEVLLFRSGVKSDTVATNLSPYEKQYLNSLLRLVDFEGGRSDDQSIGGDYTEYKLLLKCDNKVVIDRKFFGTRDISFGMRALLTNLENFSKKK